MVKSWTLQVSQDFKISLNMLMLEQKQASFRQQFWNFEIDISDSD